MNPKRKILLINPRFQIKFTLYLFLPMFVSISIFWMSIELLFYRMITFGKNSNLPEGHAYYSVLSMQKREFEMILFFLSLVLFVIFSYWGILFSHRIAGPLYKLNKYFKEKNTIDEVRKSPIFFRKKDFFLEVPDSINAFFDRTDDKP